MLALLEISFADKAQDTERHLLHARSNKGCKFLARIVKTRASKSEGRLYGNPPEHQLTMNQFSTFP
jgi:hypothetical protein